MFSLAGATISKLRCSLDSDTADMLIFINKNLRDHPEFAQMNRQVGELVDDDADVSYMSAGASSTDYPSMFNCPAVPEPVGMDEIPMPSVPMPSTSQGQPLPALPALPSMFSVKSESESQD